MVTREVGADFVQRRIGRNTGEMSCYKGKEKKCMCRKFTTILKQLWEGDKEEYNKC